MFVDEDRYVTVAPGGALQIVDITAKKGTEILRLPGEALIYPRLSGDRKYLYFMRGRSSADLWLVRFNQPQP
jgi:hypothetical protein